MATGSFIHPSNFWQFRLSRSSTMSAANSLVHEYLSLTQACSLSSHTAPKVDTHQSSPITGGRPLRCARRATEKQGSSVQHHPINAAHFATRLVPSCPQSIAPALCDDEEVGAARGLAFASGGCSLLILRGRHVETYVRHGRAYKKSYGVAGPPPNIQPPSLMSCAGESLALTAKRRGHQPGVPCWVGRITDRSDGSWKTTLAMRFALQLLVNHNRSASSLSTL